MRAPFRSTRKLTPRFGIGLLLALATFASHAVTPITELSFSPGGAIVLGTANTLVKPSNVGTDDLSNAPGSVTTDTLNLPASVRLLAMHVATDASYFVLDQAYNIGGILAGPRRVLRFDGTSYSIAFDAASYNVPNGVRIDALGMVNNTDFLLSFDDTVSLPGGLVAHAEDLVRFKFDTSTFISHFKGVNLGIPAGVNLQDVHFFDHNRQVLLTLDQAVTVGGTHYKASDVIEVNPVTNTWAVALSPSARDARWRSNGGEADLVALSARTLRRVLDIDANGFFAAGFDGVIAARYLFGFGGASLAAAVATLPAATRTTPGDLDSYMTLIRPFLDVDADGLYDAATDGVLIIRYLNGLRGTALVNGVVGANARRNTAQIEWYLSELVR
jgi:hypothetical protein